MSIYKIPFVSFLLIIATNLSHGQTNLLCNLESDFSLSENQDDSSNLSIQMEGNDEVYEFIEELMNTVNLPMNFHVVECNNKRCKNNASARMNKDGTRFIVYDDKWFGQIKKDSSNTVILTVLAHEIGHHLSAHTLALNKLNNESAIKSCDNRRPTYNQKLCDSLYKSDYTDYLYKQRMNELQADRFAGYIMNLYGAELLQIQHFFKSILLEKDDTNSTHPKLSKRLIAIEDGFSLAENSKKSDEGIDLNEIKGNPLEIVVNQIEDFKKYEIIDNIRKSISYNAIGIINKKSEFEISTYAFGYPKNKYEEMRIYLAREKMPLKIILDDEKDYFQVLDIGIQFRYNTNIRYTPHAAIHLKDSVLKILIFDKQLPRVVYSAPIEEEKVSYKEIESIFVEIFNDGFRKAIKEYEEK